MKKISFITVLAMLLALFVPVLVSADSSSAKQTKLSYTVNAVNERARVGEITVYTPEYGQTTGTEQSQNTLEIAVSDGKIVSAEGFNVSIPADGFVAVIRGSALKSEINALGLKAGDSVIFDRKSMEIVFVGENYSPFYEKTAKYDRIDGTRTENTIIIYKYKTSGGTTGTNIWGSEVSVDKNGFVISVGGNDSVIPEGGFVISAVGKTRIAELNEAAAPGMQVTVDEKTKTLTFSFNEKSLTASMNAVYVSLCAEIADAKKKFRVLDYASLDSLSAELGALIDEVSASDDMATVIRKRYDFLGKCADAEKLVTETPAVEERAIWVRPTESSDRESVNSKVKSIYEAGYNAICIEMLYNSVTIFPVDTDKYLFSQDPALKGFDVLGAYIEECHRYGIEVYGWMVCYRVSHGTTTHPELAVSTKKPEWLCKAKSGTTNVGDTAGKFLNPALPEVSEFLLNFYRYILTSYDLDGFQLDYIRYPYAPGEDFGYDDYTRGLFKDKYGTDPMNLTSDSALWETWCKFRAAFVTEFVGKVSALVNELRPDIYLAADVAPDFRDVYKKYMQEAEKWLKEGLVDIEFPMAYGTNVVPLYSSFAVEAAGENGYAYIGLGDYGVDILKREITEARDAGGDGFAFFSWSQYTDGNYAEAIASTILAERALSPSYNASAALSAQTAYISERIASADYIDPALVPEVLRTAVSSLCENVSALLETGYAEDCTGVITDAYNAVKAMNISGSFGEAVLGDIAKALKIAALSKDKEKSVYREEHPLPDPADPDESEPDISEEPSVSSEPSAASEASEVSAAAESSSGTNGKGGNGRTILITALTIGLCLAAVGTVIIIRRKMK